MDTNTTKAETLAAEWSRTRLLIVLGSVLLTGLLLLGGLSYAVITTLKADPSGTARSARVDEQSWPVNADGVRGSRYRDAVAAEPMLRTGAEDMRPAAPALGETPRMLIDPSTKTGSAGVPAGFDHTPSGAVAQLAAIEIATLLPMSIEQARDVHRAWAMDGASFEGWEIAQAIQAFHTHAGTVDSDGTVNLSAKQVGALIKGTDGPDWVLACVQLDVTAVVVEQARFGYGHCERMQWHDDRWMIAPGRAPAPAPSTWPGSQRSLEAGWRLWVERTPH